MSDATRVHADKGARDDRMTDRIPRLGEVWTNAAHPEVTYRVMSAVIEGYVMARAKGAAPFVMHLKEWQKRYNPPTRPLIVVERAK